MPVDAPQERSPAANALEHKLTKFVPLTLADRALLGIVASRDEWFQRDVDIISAGMSSRSVFVVREGMAVRYRNLPDGGRQIITFLIQGDLCGAEVFLFNEMDHSIGTITECRVALISGGGMMELLMTRPRISAALWRSSQQEAAMLRERIVALGRRDARARVAYLLCELLWRHAAVGLADDNRFRLPLTQAELADALGLTTVHVNRMLQGLRRDGLIRGERGIIHLLDVAALQEIAGFNKDYLCLEGAPTELMHYFDLMECMQNGALTPLNHC